MILYAYAYRETTVADLLGRYNVCKCLKTLVKFYRRFQTVCR